MSVFEELKKLSASEEEQNMRHNEFCHLNDICYVDYTGAGLYSQSQINQISKMMKSSVFTHPHGSSVISQMWVSEIDQVRSLILDHFDTNPDEYSLIFTSGATAAIKIVADYFHFNGGCFVHTADIHTSVLGMREVVKTDKILNLPHNRAFEILDQKNPVPLEASSDANSLFVYSAQCNFSGIKYPISWSSAVNKDHALSHHFGSRLDNWFVLLDAATYCAASRLSLKNHKPDFICMSFYKLFGFPTGLGALLVKNSSAHVLKKTYYGGGTVKIAMTAENFHVKKEILHERFEDGTMNYLAIMSVRIGLQSLNKVSKGFDLITYKVFEFARYVFLFLKRLHYPNRRPAAVLYNDTDFTEPNRQGGIVNFNLLREDGTYYGYYEVQNLANLRKIQLRTGCHCNPGACQRLLKLSNSSLKHNFGLGHVCGDSKDIIDGKPTGSVRISFGYASNWDDVRTVLNFIIHHFAPNAVLEDISNKSASGDSEKFSHPKTVTVNKDTIFNRKELSKATGAKVPDIIDDTIVTLTPTGVVESIFVYPVKSCGYYQVKDKWELTSSGLQYDRQWMIVNQSGVALTQKHNKRLCLIQPDIDIDKNVLSLHFNGSKSCVKVRLSEDENNDEPSGDLCKSKVCNDQIVGYDCGDYVADWLDENLNHTGLRLVRIKERTSKHNLNSFSNMGQYLLITTPSVENTTEFLNQKHSANFENKNFVHRFRSNFVVRGNFEPFNENFWKRVVIKTNANNTVPFLVRNPCVRCQYIYVDQETGDVTDVPLGITQFGIYIDSDFATEVNQTVTVGLQDRVYVEAKNN